MGVIRAVLSLLRPGHWIKNLLVLLPLFFAGQADDPRKLAAALLAAAALCLVASGIYVLNDLLDVEFDRLHPRKRQRPLAAGRIPVSAAWLLSLASIAAGLGIAAQAAWPTVVTVGAYLALNVAYCLGLKHQAIVDVFSVATGFVLRVLAGGQATGIAVSPWLVIMTFLLALFLVLGKRRDDLAIADPTAAGMRPALRGYTVPFVDVCMGLLTSLLAMTYILYCLSPEVVQRRHGQWVYLSSVLVLAGIFRYLQIAIVRQGTFCPTQVFLQDRFIQAVVLLWVMFFVQIIYL